MAEYIIDGTSSNPSIKEMKQPKHYITMTSTSSSFNINSSNDGNKIYIPHRPIWLKIPIQTMPHDCHSFHCCQRARIEWPQKLKLVEK